MNAVVTLNPYVRVVNAEDLKVGRQLLTEDGWQTIKGLVIFIDADQVRVYTDEREDGDPDHTTDGWPFHFGDPVRTRLEPTAEQEYQAKRRERLERRRLQRLVRAAADCPNWCVEHYDGGEGDERQRNHSAGPLSVDAADVHTGAPKEFGFWLERRDTLATGDTETVVVIEVRPHADDIELTPAAVLQLAARLSSLGHRGGMYQ